MSIECVHCMWVLPKVLVKIEFSVCLVSHFMGLLCVSVWVVITLRVLKANT